jgi:spore coat polysaccharide biosynthesis protein SpsF
MERFVLVMQARSKSTRLPNKVLMDLLGRPMIVWQVENLRKLGLRIVVATSDEREDDEIFNLIKSIGIDCIRGPEQNVFARFQKAKEEFPSLNYIRITADCPLISPQIIENIKQAHSLNHADYTSNTIVRSYPDGLDVEVFKAISFDQLSQLPLDDFQREHVTPGFYQNLNQFDCQNVLEPRRLGNYRWTVDYQSDFNWVKKLLLDFGGNYIPEYEEILQYLSDNKHMIRLQESIENA